MKYNLLILGAGQYGMVAKEIAESMGDFEKIAFLDDKNEMAIGKLSDYLKFVNEFDSATVAVSNADVRLQYMEKLERADLHIITLVSPKAYIAPSSQIGKGSIIEPMAVINANSAVGNGTIVCAGAIVNHNATVGKGCLLQCGSIVTAASTVPDRTRLNYGEIYCKAEADRAMQTPKGNDYKFEDGM